MTWPLVKLRDLPFLYVPALTLYAMAMTVGGRPTQPLQTPPPPVV